MRGPPMTAQSTLNQLCVYLGGPYDAVRRLYTTAPAAPVVAGLYVVKRAWVKQDDHALYTLGAVPQPLSGALMVVQAPVGTERRIAVGGAVSGVKKVAHAITLHTYVRSKEPYAEDSQDFGYALKDAIFARLRADRTCGSGGFEAGGFQIGETEPWLRWGMGQAQTSDGLTKVYLRIECEAHEYIQA